MTAAVVLRLIWRMAGAALSQDNMYPGNCCGNGLAPTFGPHASWIREYRRPLSSKGIPQILMSWASFGSRRAVARGDALNCD